jgi:hypothetical protein
VSAWRGTARGGKALRRLCLGVAAAMLAACAYQGLAWAGPPFVTDDPEPVELHHWEVYVASTEVETASDRSGTAPHIEVNNGIAPDLQAHVIMPYAFDRSPGGPLHRGYGDTELGLKYRFVQEGPSRPMAGTFPLVEVPTGDANRGLGSGHTQWFLPIWLQKSWGPWTTYGGGGYWINPGAGNRNWTFLGWEVQKDLSERVTLGGEVFRTTPSEVGGRTEVSFNLGGYYNFDDEHHLMASAGRGNEDTGFMGYVAFQWTFGPGVAGRESGVGDRADETVKGR